MSPQVPTQYGVTRVAPASPPIAAEAVAHIPIAATASPPDTFPPSTVESVWLSITSNCSNACVFK